MTGVLGGVAVARGPAGSAAVAAGSRYTADAAAEVLRAGGGAVDAVVAAGFAAAVAEPGLSSPGGGGFLLSREPGGAAELSDFFVDVPGREAPPGTRPGEFVPVTIQFPAATQVFHAGWGSVAVPGCLSGYLDAHARHGRLPLAAVVAPAARLARTGIRVEPAQAEVLGLIGEVLAVTPQSRALFEPAGRPLRTGETFANPGFAAFLDALAAGEIARLDSPAFAEPLLDAMAAHGGMVTRADLASYEPADRVPLITAHGGARILTNPPPSYGGAIVVDALAHLHRAEIAGDEAHRWAELVRALRTATRERRAADRAAGMGHVPTGTTHVSVVDARGGFAAMTTSNGSCAGVVVPGWDVQLNNMLGEEDLNPAGFHALPPGTRLGSMMAPTLVEESDGGVVALGSGGSERIRSALLSVLVRLVDLGLPLADAIAAPRVHPDAEHSVQVEPGLPDDVLAALRRTGAVRIWSAPDLYFGGVHAVRRAPDGSVEAVGDPRRGGAVAVVPPV